MKHKRLALLAAGVAFALGLGLIALRGVPDMPWYVLLALPLAVMRAAVTISENEVMSWLREPFCVTAPDDCGAGDSVNPKPGSVIGMMISCPICTGTWCALLLVGLYSFVPSAGTAAILVLGAAGGSEWLYYAKERNAWSARLARVQDGQIEGGGRARGVVRMEDGRVGMVMPEVHTVVRRTEKVDAQRPARK